MQPLDDTIAALATAPGIAGLAVVRVSGEGALTLSDRVFRGGVKLADALGNTLHHGWAVDEARDDARLDEVVVAVFRAPRSFTGEDTVEWSCHGGAVPARRVQAALLAAGARLAGPGEFSLRAFLHGRMDLAQAEAVADLVHAETESASDLALAQLSGELGRRLAKLEELVLEAAAEVEARVDFAEDVGGIEIPEEVCNAIATMLEVLDSLLESAPWARAVREGVRIPIVGKPNAGKSSLFNALLGEDRAIVSDEPGTTRDRVSEKIEISGVPITLDGAALVLWVVDGSVPFDPAGDPLLAQLEGRNAVIAMTKADLGVVLDPMDPIRAAELGEWWAFNVSVVTGQGLIELKSAISVQLGAGTPGGLASAVANPRHTDALARARGALGRAGDVAAGGRSGEIVALELREALAAIGEVTGRHASEELLERIFSRFCIGK